MLPEQQNSVGKKSEIHKVVLLLPLQWQPQSPLSPLSGRHLVNPLFLPPRLDATLFPYLMPPPPFPACLGDTWLGLSLILGWLFPADEGFAWQHSAARHEHDKKWKTACQSPCQCRHEMKSEGEERWVLDSSEGEIKKYSMGSCVICWRAHGRTQAKQVFSFFYPLPLLHLFVLFLVLLSFLCLHEKLKTCVLSLRLLCYGRASFFFCFFLSKVQKQDFESNRNIQKQAKQVKNNLSYFYCGKYVTIEWEVTLCSK